MPPSSGHSRLGFGRCAVVPPPMLPARPKSEVPTRRIWQGPVSRAELEHMTYRPTPTHEPPSSREFLAQQTSGKPLFDVSWIALANVCGPLLWNQNAGAALPPCAAQRATPWIQCQLLWGRASSRHRRISARSQCTNTDGVGMAMSLRNQGGTTSCI